MADTVHKRFTCRHCGKDISVDGNKFIHEGERAGLNVMTQGIEVYSLICNLCGKINLCVSTKHYGSDMTELSTCKGKVKELFVFPLHTAPVEMKFVPMKYLKEFNEAIWVKEISPKSCALMCRRITEIILEEECGCTKFNLSAKLVEFKANYNPQDYIVDSIEYIIGAGNAAAHNKKNLNDDLIKITEKDCKWLLDAVQELFDIIFIKPKKVEEYAKRKQKVIPKKN